MGLPALMSPQGLRSVVRCGRVRVRSEKRCRNPVKEPGLACRFHRGPPVEQVAREEPRVFDRVDPIARAQSQAHSLLFVYGPGIGVTATRHVGGAFRRVTGQSAARCDVLSEIARALLAGVGTMRRWTAEGIADLSGAEADLVDTAIAAVPLPAVGEVVMAARLLQLAGIMLCHLNGVALEECPCFMDVTGVDGTRTLASILKRGGSDWGGLAELERPEA